MKNKKKKKNLLLYILFGGFILKLLCFVFKNKKTAKIKENFCRFLKKEKKEVNELAEGDQSFKRYCKDSFSIFVNYFIPHECNDYKPKILRTKSLAIIALLVFSLKVFVLSYAFLIYPYKAQMSEKMIAEVQALINNERLVNNLNTLETNIDLEIAATAKAKDILTEGYFSHYGPDGKKPWDWIDRGSYAYLFVGENLAMNFSSAQTVHKALMQSPTHRKNILNPNYEDIGLSIVSGEFNGKKTNILVQFFGSREKNISPSIDLAKKDEKDEKIVQAIKKDETEVLGVEKEDETVELIQPLEQEIKTYNEMSKAVSGFTEISKKQAVNFENIADEEEKIVEPVFNSKTENVNNNIVPSVAVASLNEVTKEINVEQKNVSALEKVLGVMQYVYLAILAFVALALIVNIIIKISIQHKSAIIEALMLLLFIGGLASVNAHILSSVVEKITII